MDYKYIKLFGSDNSDGTGSVVSVEIPILGIKLSEEIIGDTVTNADGTQEQGKQTRYNYEIRTAVYDTNDYTASFKFADILYIMQTIRPKNCKFISVPSTSGLAIFPRWGDATNYPLSAFSSGKIRVDGFSIDIEEDWETGGESAIITCSKYSIN